MKLITFVLHPPDSFTNNLMGVIHKHICSKRKAQRLVATISISLLL